VLGYSGIGAFPPFRGMREPLECLVSLGYSMMGMTSFKKSNAFGILFFFEISGN